MFKSTLFIAVKCCECATMQVKQQKKSSNKWICVVCNQKQSVTRIYAQGYQAKHIRNVVQSFNMSHKFQDDQLLQEVPSLSRFVEHDEGVQEVGENSNGKRRTDWSEYIDDDDNVEPAYLKSKLTGGSTKEIKEGSSNVTPMWDECIVDDSDPLRDVSRRQCRQQGQQQQQNKALPPMKTGTSKQNKYKNDFPGEMRTHSELQEQRQPSKRMATMKASASEWSKYMAEEDDYDGGGDKEVRAPAFADDLMFMRGYKPENDDVDQLIEEEIHPDFI